MDPVAVRVDAPDLALEARGGEVAEDVVAVGAVALAGADDRDRARAQRAATGRCLAVDLSGGSGPTPRRSSARATISRWISLVPSQIRSTRSSRRKRSATLERM